MKICEVIRVKKVFVIKDGDDWSLTTEEGHSDQLASIEQIKAELERGEKPFTDTIVVEEGVFFYDSKDKKYVTLTQKWKGQKLDSSSVANILTIIGAVIMIFGFIFGLFHSNGLGILFVWGSAFASGMLFVGLGEVINVLLRIEKKIK
jgi:hypothetical protein